MNAGDRKKIVQQAGALGQLYADQQIELEIFGRFMVKLAHDLMLGDELQLSVGVCTEIPDRYFEEILPGQMVDDEDFAHIAERLSKLFRVHGFAEVGVTINILPRVGVA